ncbi:Amine oxidase [Sulfitobacter noctilucae]|uniref:NAD(P)-binding protein n=1 Tax=Sulfitobacter noctilucae TaxID=1342302 RepID=UPI000468EA00|nr:NAD(P)-binding protein [Sulfitobacter noctilucae]KIN61588.1 Amine oxidase [Sulfitobacter noctilucae]
MKLGIIGGGIGGLAVAWNLNTDKDNNIMLADAEIHIFEAEDRFGGNAETKEFNFGNGPGFEKEPLIRWADMGVNDFNIPAYLNIVDVMKKIGFTKGKDYRNLEDSTTYYNTMGHAMTANSTPDGKPDPWWGTAMPEDLRASVDDFMKTGGADGDNEKFHDYTMEDYINYGTETYKWDPRLGPEIIYPRVNGMYFTSGPLGPRAMPFAAVMHYYKIQEGAGSSGADRNYFVGGASKWIDALVEYMKANMPNMIFHAGFKAQVVPNGDNADYTVRNTTKGAVSAPVTCSHICIATPADVALRAMAGGDAPGNRGLPQKAANIMSQVTYETAISVAHTDSRLMPVNRNAWSTYNIVIHEPGSVALKPYVINYVANRHQNDAANAEFNKFGLPEFFVSVNPHIPVAEDKVLKDTSGNAAVANLKHFVFDFDCMQAQTDILPQQGVNNIFYASGWTMGSGLHTECWTQGTKVAAMIMEHAQSDGASVDKNPRPTRAALISERLGAAAAGQLPAH